MGRERECARQTELGAQVAIVSEQFDLQAADLRVTLEASPAMIDRRGLVAGEMMGGGEHPFGDDARARGPALLGDDAASPRRDQPALEVAKPREEEIKPGQKAKLRQPAPARLRKVKQPVDQRTAE